MSRLPEGMTAPTWERISKLPSDTRDRVLERAAKKIASGMPVVQADEEALLEEAGIHVQQRLVGT